MNVEILPDLIDRWLDALESGAYTQTEGTLCRTIDDTGVAVINYSADAKCGFCCLGVLLDVMQPDGWGRNEGAFTRPHVLGNRSDMKDAGIQYSSIIDKDVWVQLKMAFPFLPSQDDLASMNDVEEATFADIAEFISACRDNYTPPLNVE